MRPILKYVDALLYRCADCDSPAPYVRLLGPSNKPEEYGDSTVLVIEMPDGNEYIIPLHWITE